MSRRGRTEHVTLLRAAIARIEAEGVTARGLTSGHGFGARRQDDRSVIPLGSRGFSLDAVLGGGLRRGALHEVVPATPRDEGTASGFALALAARCLTRHGVLVWIIDGCASTESGGPYRPGLQSHGLDPDRLIVVRTQGASSTLWATEEALRVRDIVVLTELWGGRHYGLAPSRRLVLAARANGGVGLLLHAGLAGGTDALSSGSETRFSVGPLPSPRRASVGRRLPVPGEAAFAVRLDKVRAATRDFDRHQALPLLWNAEQRCFHDHDFSVAVAPAPVDRPAQAPERRRLG